MRIAAHLLVLRARRATGRAARARRRQLERELRDYATAAQRLDLEATLDRYPDAVTHEVRDILARQSHERDSGGWPALGQR